MSEKSAEIVPGLVAGGGRIRTKYSADAKRALVQLCTRPGVSVARMALSHGINANLLRKWIKQFADGQAPVRASKRA